MSGFSIKRRLILSLIAALLVLYAFTAVGVYSFVASMAWKHFDEALEDELRDFILETRVAGDGSIEADFHELDLPQFGAKEGTSYYQLWDRDHETILKSPSMPAEVNLPLAGLALDEIAVVSAELPGGVSGRVASVAVVPESEKVPGASRNTSRVYLAVGDPDGSVRSMLSKLAGAQAVSGVLLALCGILTIRVVVDRSCRPLQYFASIASTMDSDNLGERLPEARSPEEVRPFLVQINRMLDRVEEGIERERRFSASVAHELRTPIAEIRSLMEVALTDGADESLRENPADVYREGAGIAARMEALVDRLSQLLRGKSLQGDHPERRNRIGVDNLVEASVAVHRGDADGREIDIKIEAANGEDVEIATDAVVIRSLLDNLVSNAVWHAPEGTGILIRSEIVEGSLVRFEVTNEKGDFEGSDIELMAEPFWQKDASRTEPDRFGLGLALATAYADLLSSDLRLETRGDLFVASFCVPRAPCRIPVKNLPEESRRRLAVK